MPFIIKSSDGCCTFHIRQSSIQNILPTQWTTIQLVMESWSIGRNDINGGMNPTIGWEYDPSISPMLIKKAFEKCSGLECRIY